MSEAPNAEEKPVKLSFQDYLLETIQDAERTTVDGVRTFMVSVAKFNAIRSRANPMRCKLSRDSKFMLIEINPYLELGRNFYYLATPITLVVSRRGPLDEAWERQT